MAAARPPTPGLRAMPMTSSRPPSADALAHAARVQTFGCSGYVTVEEPREAAAASPAQLRRVVRYVPIATPLAGATPILGTPRR